MIELPRTQGGWKAILADPAWPFRGYVKNQNPESTRSAERHYKTMSLAEIKAMPVREVAAPDSHLMLWTTSTHMPSALEVLSDWGFKYSGFFANWFKLRRGIAPYQLTPIEQMTKELHFGMGHTTRKNSEICLLGRRGNARRNSKSVFEILVAPVREHSRKPDEIYEMVEAYCDGPYLDLFARQSRSGWVSWGNERTKFD